VNDLKDADYVIKAVAEKLPGGKTCLNWTEFIAMIPGSQL
jgi:hypothetical protein